MALSLKEGAPCEARWNGGWIEGSIKGPVLPPGEQTIRVAVAKDSQELVLPPNQLRSRPPPPSEEFGTSNEPDSRGQQLKLAADVSMARSREKP